MPSRGAFVRMLISSAAIVLGAIAFGLLVWPTRYRTIPISAVATVTTGQTAAGELAPLAAREDRLTGAVELLTVAGWVAASPPPGAPVTSNAADPSTAGDSLHSLARKFGGGQD